jgi:hypothetical protein
MKRPIAPWAVVVLLSLTGCAGSDAEAATTTAKAPTITTAETAPFHDIFKEAAVVSGTATCGFDPTAGVDPEGGAGWFVTCELDMSDPKVGGTETHDRIRMIDAGEEGIVWVAEEAVITNAEGTWRGTAQAADDGRPSGEAHYFGEGAYEGLAFHYYFGQFPEEYDDETTVIRGWIYDGG